MMAPFSVSPVTLPPPVEVLLLVTSSIIIICSTTANAVVTPGPPSQDAFYKRPHNLERYQLGDVIRTRKVTASQLPRTAHVTERVATQLVYRTSDTHQKPSWSVTTIFKPSHPQNPPQILSVQQEEDSVNLDCAPSYLAAVGPRYNNNWLVAFFSNIFHVEHALKRGWYVVLPDHEGPKSAFIAGFEEGKAGLDSLRAARNYMKFPHDTEIGLTGYSGGGHATAWMSNLAGVYAPDLNIIGAAHGGTPVHLPGVLRLISGSLFSGFAYEAALSFLRLYPTLEPIESAHDKQLASVLTAWEGNCLIETLLIAPLMDFIHDVAPPYKSFFDSSAFQEILKNESLLSAVSPLPVYTPKFPRLIYHAQNDEVIPRADVEQYIRERCDDGDHIQYQITTPLEHIAGEYGGIPGILQYLDDVFAHTVSHVACGSSQPSFKTLDSPNIEAELGKDYVERIRSQARMAQAITDSGKALLKKEKHYKYKS